MLVHSSSDLRALFPSLYSKRDNSASTDRNWQALRVPVIRLMGPFWTFGVSVASLDAAPRMDVLHEDVEPRIFEQGDPPYHRPTLLRAVVERFWDGRTPSDLVSTNKSRLSLVAAHSVLPNSQDIISPMEAPEDGQDNNYNLVTEHSTPLILAPFGSPPRPMMPLNGEQEKDLAAMRIVSGQIALRPTVGYMAALRRALNVGAPDEADPDENTLILTAEGAAFRGGIQFPWSDKTHITWLRLTARDLDAETYDPVLRLWTDEAPNAGVDADLAGLIQSVRDASSDKLRWFGLAPRRELGAEDLFWRCHFHPTLALLKRQADPSRAVTLESAALEPLLKNPAGQALSMKARAFELHRYGDTLVIRSEIGDDAHDPAAADPSGHVDVAYTVSDGETEIVTISQDEGAMDLAVPLRSNAERLRSAMGFEPPHPVDDSLLRAPLWLFTPLNEGWVHWPFPNATTALLGRYVDVIKQPKVPPPSVASGSWSVRQASDGKERSWDISLLGAKAARLHTRFKIAEEVWELECHSLTFQGSSIIFDGAIPVTAFAQTSEQFLPEPQTRALAPEALRAVSPDLLTGLEAQLWDLRETGGADAIYSALTLAPITLSPGKTRDRAELTCHLKKLEVGWPEDEPEQLAKMNSWVWLRHHALPSYQTMPLCLAGRQRNMPSGTREFAPFVGPSPSNGKTGLVFSGTVDVSAPHVAMKFEGAWTNPLSEAPWQNEVGQVFATLTSVTAFPGDGTKRSLNHTFEGDITDEESANFGFGSLNPLQGWTISHDLATNYELYAMATLPPPKSTEELDNPAAEDAALPQLEPEEAAEPPIPKDPTFRPGRWNRPGSYDDGPGWLDVWSDLNRKLAVSAVEKSTLVDQDLDENYSLPNLLVDQNYALAGAPSIEPNVGYSINEEEFGLPSTTVDSLSHIGALSFEISGISRIRLEGLPSTEELSGLSLEVPRTLRNIDGDVETQAPVQLDLGTLEQSGRGLVDQGGWQLENSYQTDDVFVRTARKYGATRAEEWALVTRKKALVLKSPSLPDIRLSLQDLACSRADGGWKYAVTDAAVPGIGADLNAISGYTWSLSQEELKDYIFVDRLAFRPLLLKSVQLNDNFDPIEVVVEGAVAAPLPSYDDASIVFGEAQGTATLTVTWDGGAPRTDIKSAFLSLPCADPGRSWPPVPWIDIMGLNYGGGSQLSGANIMLRARSDDLELALELTSALPVATEENQLALSFVAVQLGKVGYANDIWKSSAARVIVAARARFALNGELEDATGTGSLRFMANLVSGLVCGQALLSFGDIRASLPLDRRVFLGKRGQTRKYRVDADGTPQLDLFSILSEQELSARFASTQLNLDARFAGLAAKQQEAVLSCVLARASAQASFKIVDASTAARLSYVAAYTPPQPVGAAEPLPTVVDDSVSADLIYLTQRRPASENAPNYGRDVRLFLTAQAKNAIPIPALSDENRHVADQFIQHRLTARVFGARLPLEDLHPDRLMINASTLHTFSAPGAPDAQIHLVQPFVLLPASDANGLVTEQIEGHASSFFGPGSDQATHWAHTEASANTMPYGLNEIMVEDLKTYQGQRPIIMAGAHTLISGYGDDDSTLTHLPIPFVSAIGDDGLFASWTDSDYVLRPAPELRYPPLETRATQSLQRRLNTAQQQAVHMNGDLANGLLDRTAAKSRPMFVSRAQVSTDDGENWHVADLTAPATETGKIVSKWLSSPTAKKEPGKVYGLFPTAPDYDVLLGPKFLQNGLSKTSSAALLDSWEALPQVEDNLLPGGKDVLIRISEQPVLQAKVLARSAAGDVLIEIATTQLRLQKDTDIESILEGLMDWAQIALARRAPWARSGLMSATTTLGSDPVRFTARSVYAPLAANRIVERAAQLDGGPRAPDPALIPATGDAVTPEIAGLVAGYQNVGHHAEIVTSEQEAVLNQPDTDARLTSVAAVSAYALATSTTRRLVPEGGAAWLSDRETVAPRAFKAFMGDKDRLTPAVVPGTRLARPAAFHPSKTSQSPLPAAASSKGQRAYVPASQVVSSVGARAGVLATRRLGLELQPETSVKPPVRAAETPMVLRSPRPVVLGVNDRTRASAYENGHFALTNTPEAVVFGPGKARDVLNEVPEALDRSPRAKYGFILELTEPEAGIFAIGRGTQVKLSIQNVFGDPAPPPTWTIHSASIKVGDLQYLGTPSENKLLIQNGQSLTLGGFTQVLGAPEGVPASAGGAIANLPLGSTVELTLLLGGDGVVRLVTLPLFSRNADNPLIETPAFLRFDDPEYNDILSSTSRISGPRAIITNQEFSAYADRTEISQNDVLIIGLDNVTKENRIPFEAKPPRKLKLSNGTEILVGIEVKRSSPGPGTEGREDITYKLDVPLICSLSDAGDFATICLPLFLAEPQQQDGMPVPNPLLRPKDRLSVFFTGDVTKLELAFDVAQITSEPSNPAAYGVLRLDQSGPGNEQVSIPLYGRGSPASVIEMVDPLDMRGGQVRRRAHYRWHSFQHLSAQALTRVTLQKSGRTGASWLPSDLASGWSKLLRVRTH